jgi:hypothetical protein
MHLSTLLPLEFEVAVMLPPTRGVFVDNVLVCLSVTVGSHELVDPEYAQRGHQDYHNPNPELFPTHFLHSRIRF